MHELTYYVQVYVLFIGACLEYLMRMPLTVRDSF